MGTKNNQANNNVCDEYFGYVLLRNEREFRQYLSQHEFIHNCSSGCRPADECHRDLSVYLERTLGNIVLMPWSHPHYIAVYEKYVLPVNKAGVENAYKVLTYVYANVDCRFKDVTDLYASDIEEFNRQERLKVLPALIYASYEAALNDDTQCYPMVAQVTVRFNDEEEEVERDIALLPMNELEGRVDDDEIFFYVDGIDQLASLARPDNGEDFVVVGINGYSHYPEPEKPSEKRISSLATTYKSLKEEIASTLSDVARKGFTLSRQDAMKHDFSFTDQRGSDFLMCGMGMDNGKPTVLGLKANNDVRSVLLDSIPSEQHPYLLMYLDEVLKSNLATF